MNIPELYSKIGIRLEQTFMTNSTSGIHGDSVRESMILYGWDSFLQRPIFGWGHASFKFLFGNFFGRYVYSHNNYIELLTNLGLIGFVYYYGFYIYIIKKIVKVPSINMKSKNLKHFFIAFFISLFFLEMGIISYYSQVFIQVFIAISVKFISIQKKNRLIIDRGKFDEKQK
jgi:O-antigen ligase